MSFTSVRSARTANWNAPIARFSEVGHTAAIEYLPVISVDLPDAGDQIRKRHATNLVIDGVIGYEAAGTRGLKAAVEGNGEAARGGIEHLHGVATAGPMRHLLSAVSERSGVHVVIDDRILLGPH